MTEGLKLRFSGEELRKLLAERIDDHRARADRWAHEQSRTSEDETEDAPLLPEHICTNETERHVWRADVLQFIHDHVEPAETYRLSGADLEFGELLPPKPGWLEQHEYEERTSVGFNLERVTKAVDRLAAASERPLWSPDVEHATAVSPGIIEETDEFRATRVDTGGGPEVIMIERK
jgi:hypothetical protein